MFVHNDSMNPDNEDQVNSQDAGADQDEGLSMKDIFDICSPDGVSPGYMGDGVWINSDGSTEER